MDLERARKLIHSMKSSVGVVETFVRYIEPDDDDEDTKELKTATQRSMEKLFSALKELDEMTDGE